MSGALTIVTGCPGTGKTTLCTLLAEAAPKGIHLVTDTFYDFLAHPIDPTDPISHTQNSAVVTAFSRAAAEFAGFDYEVFVDGIVGPWFLPVAARAMQPLGIPIAYVVLRAPLEVALARATERALSADPRMVRHMHGAFEDLGDYEKHAVDAEHASPHELANLLRANPHARDLDLGRLAGR